jgi:hypothetical protein
MIMFSLQINSGLNPDRESVVALPSLYHAPHSTRERKREQRVEVARLRRLQKTLCIVVGHFAALDDLAGRARLRFLFFPIFFSHTISTCITLRFADVHIQDAVLKTQEEEALLGRWQCCGSVRLGKNKRTRHAQL